MKKTLATLSTLALLTQSAGGLMISTAFAVDANIENIYIVSGTKTQGDVIYTFPSTISNPSIS